MSDQTPEVVRPDGRAYRARKAPAVLNFDGDDASCGVIVIRTHDVERALDLAAATLCDHAADPLDFRLGWVRQTMRDGDPWWIEDAARGCPAVIWDCP